MAAIALTLPLPHLLLGAATACGILSHQLLFIRGDWDRHTPRLVPIFGALPGLLAVAVRGLQQRESLLQAFSLAFTIFVYYIAGLFSSIVVYRVLFHPLSHFPGPRAAGVSALWNANVAVAKMRWHLRVQELHLRFGNVVRISRSLGLLLLLLLFLILLSLSFNFLFCLFFFFNSR
jgi:hypothetical protein